MGTPEAAVKEQEKDEGDESVSQQSSPVSDTVETPAPSTWSRLTGAIGSYIPSMPSLPMPTLFSSSEQANAPSSHETKKLSPSTIAEYEDYHQAYLQLRDKMTDINKYYTIEKTRFPKKRQYFFSLLTWQSDNRPVAMTFIKTLAQTLPRNTIPGRTKEEKLDTVIKCTGILLGLCVYITESIEKEYEDSMVTLPADNSALYRVLDKELRAKKSDDINKAEWLGRKKLYVDTLGKYIEKSKTDDRIIYGDKRQSGHLRDINVLSQKLGLEKQKAETRLLSQP